MGFIYRIRNRLTQKCYIGETTAPDPEKRWKEHLNTIKRGRGCPALRDAIQKYGVEAFEFKVLIICFDEDRFHYEREYIQRYNTQIPNGYNILPGGVGGAGFKGKKNSEETKERLRKTSSDAWNRLSEEEKERRRCLIQTCLKQIDIKAKITQSEKWIEHVARLRKTKIGTTHTTEIKEKIRNSVNKYYAKGDTTITIIKHRDAMSKAVGRPVNQYSAEGTLIKSFKSISEAGRESGVKSNNIGHALKGTYAKAGGFIWKYLEV